VLVVIERYPSLEMLQVAVDNAKVLKDDVTRPALVVAQKIEQKEEAAKLLQKLGIERMKIEIVKATYGAGSTQKDVTDILKKLAGDYPVIVLPKATYTASFAGDPLPGSAKQLKISYKIDGKAGEVSLAENAPVVLPVPK
jgi:hypothetical protein